MDKLLEIVNKLIEEHEEKYCTLYSEAQDSIEGPKPEEAYDKFYDVGRYDCLLRIKENIRILMEEE